jgi:phenylacetate-coenzyme A ligase PaaK-like adenylate-forming protein
LNLIELVDEDLRPLPRGRRSANILLTNFSNKLTPLISYEIRDQFQLTTEHCACGLAYLKVDDVIGRSEGIFDYGSGLKVHPPIFSAALGQNQRLGYTRSAKPSVELRLT